MTTQRTIGLAVALALVASAICAETGKWHSLAIRIVGDQVRVAIDADEAGSFTSAGFAHPAKRMLRLSVPRQAVVDDVKIYSAGASL